MQTLKQNCKYTAGETPQIHWKKMGGETCKLARLAVQIRHHYVPDQEENVQKGDGFRNRKFFT